MAATQDYLPGRAADVYLPDSATRAPVVVLVLVPGGGWLTAERGGLAPLAEYLASHGMFVVNATHRAVGEGGGYPSMVQEVVCSIDFAAERARQAGLTVSQVVVLGHSSGGHLAALAALGGQRFRADCPYPPATVHGLIGLAGAYDVGKLADVAEPFFGASAAEQPQRWREGNPLTWVAQRTQAPALRVLLAHGRDDDTLPVGFTQSFAAALREAGHPVETVILPGQDHASIYSPKVIGSAVVEWVNRSGTPSASTA